MDNRAVVEDVVWECKALSPFPMRADCSRLQTFWMDSSAASGFVGGIIDLRHSSLARRSQHGVQCA